MKKRKRKKLPKYSHKFRFEDQMRETYRIMKLVSDNLDKMYSEIRQLRIIVAAGDNRITTVQKLMDLIGEHYYRERTK